MPEQIFPDRNCSPWVIHTGADEKCEEEGVAEVEGSGLKE